MLKLTQLKSKGYTKILFQILCLVGCTVLSPALTKVALADLASINKSFSPRTINPGDKSTLTIKIFNSANRPLTGVNLTDNMPALAGANIKIASPANITNSCGGSISAPSGTSTIQLTGGNVAAAVAGTPTSCTITIDVTSSTSGTQINEIPANALQNNENDSNNQAASDNLEVSTIKPLTVSNGFNASTIFSGGTSNYSITINNPNVGLNQPNTSVTVPLPNNVTLSGTPTSTCGGSFTGTIFTGGTIPVATNATTPGKCVLTFPVTSTTTGSYPAILPAGTITTDRGATNPSPSGTATLNVQTSGTNLPPTLSKAFTGLTEEGTSTLTITIDNPNTLALTNVSLTDNLPTGMTIATPASPTTNCGGTVTTPTTSTVTLTGGTVPKATTAAGSCKITVKVTTNQTSGTPLVNVISAGNITNDQNLTNGADATATATVSPALVLAKKLNPSTILPNQSATLSLEIKNNSSKNATGVKLTDNFPIGMKLFNPVGGTVTDCGTPTIVSDPNGTIIDITGATILPGKTCIVTREVTSSTGGIYDNKILKNTLISDQGWTEKNDRNAKLTVRSGFSLTKRFSPSTVTPNTPVQLIVTLTNETPNPITNAVVTDTWTNDSVIASTPSASTSCATGTITATSNTKTLKITNATVPPMVGSIPGTCTFQAYVVSATTGNKDNTIGATKATTAQGLTNVEDAKATLVVQNMVLGITKGFTPVDQIDGGDPVTLVIKLSNQNNVVLDNATFTDTMPTGMQVFTSPNPTTTCGGIINATPGSSSFSFIGGIVPANGTCDIALQVTSVKSGNLTNVIPANAVTSLQGATNPQPASKSLTVLPSVAVQKSFDPTIVDQGQTSTLAIDLLNSNTFLLNGAALTDTFPAGLVVANPAGLTNGCGGTVNAAPGSGSLVLSSGTIPASGSCRITVVVKATQAGTLTNTIPTGGLVTSSGLQNKKPTVATIQVTPVAASDPNLILLKRITKINNVPTGKAADGSLIDFTTVIPQPDNPATPRDESGDAANPGWIANYPQGAIDGGVIKSGDQVEYTIYFLSAGGKPVTNANFCDWVPKNTSFVPEAYGIGQGIQLAIGSNVNTFTNVPDGDRGVFYSPGSVPPATYPNGSTIKLNCATPAGTDGAVVVNLVNNSLTAPDNQLPQSTAAGTPVNSYGFVRFVSQIK